MKNNYLIALNKGWEDLLRKAPEEVVECMHVIYLKDKCQYIVPHLNERYIVDCNEQTIRNIEGNSEAGIELSILILHYLSFFTAKKDMQDKWVSLREIPNGGSLFYPAFHRESINGLIKAFGHDSNLFLKCARKLGGNPGSLGTASAIFEVFPKIRLYVIIWEGDSEFPANANVLFDPSISHFLHIESIIAVGGYLVKRLLQLSSICD